LQLKIYKDKKYFSDFFISGKEYGAAFSIIQKGKPLINLWGGYKNLKR